MQDFLIILDPDLHGSFQDVVELLTRMGDLLDRRVLLLLIIVVNNEIRIRNSVLEQRRDVLDENARLHRRQLTAARAGQRVAGKERSTSFEKFHDFNIEDRRAFVNERERKIRAALLIHRVVLEGKSGHIRHLLLRVSAVNTQRHDTIGNFLLHFQCCPILYSSIRHYKNLLSKIIVR